MRIFASVLLGIFITVFAHSAFAACGPNALGTHRTIELDPKDHQFITGDEKFLGLKNREVILTFDDGPIGRHTSRVLKALRDECVKATFFTVGQMARVYKKLLRRILRDGHTLGHHTDGHNRLPYYSVKKAARLIDKGIKSVERIAYGEAMKKPRVPFFRYPYLAYNKATNRMVAAKGLIAFDANIDSSDWTPGSSPSAVHNRIMRRLRAQKKGIILMHDIHYRTAKMLPRLLRTLKKEGYKVVHMVPKGGLPKITPDTTDPVLLANIEPDLVRAGASAHTPAPEEDAIFKLNKGLQLDAAVTVAKPPKRLAKKRAGKKRIGKRRSNNAKAKNFVILGDRSSRMTPPPVLKPVSSPAPVLAEKAFITSADQKPLITQSIPVSKTARGVKRSAIEIATPKTIAAKARQWKLRSSHWILR